MLNPFSKFKTKVIDTKLLTKEVREVTFSNPKNITGRVTKICAETLFPSDAQFFLCGHTQMIKDRHQILAHKNIPKDQIFMKTFTFECVQNILKFLGFLMQDKPHQYALIPLKSSS